MERRRFLAAAVAAVAWRPRTYAAPASRRLLVTIRGRRLEAAAGSVTLPVDLGMDLAWRAAGGRASVVPAGDGVALRIEWQADGADELFEFTQAVRVDSGRPRQVPASVPCAIDVRRVLL